MKKILFACEGNNFSQKAFDFAKKLQRVTPLTLTGTFLPEVNLSMYWNYAAASQTGLYCEELGKEETREVEENIRQFVELCQRGGMSYEVCNCVQQEAIPSLERESRFADAMIIGSQHFYADIDAHLPNPYLKEILHHSECPVLLVPDTALFPDSIVFCYDGSASSVHAIRQFAYLFAEWKDLPLTVLHLGEHAGDPVPNKEVITDLLRRHFTRVEVWNLARSVHHVMHWLEKVQSPIVVCGAYGRSDLSRLLSRSFINVLIRDQKLPLFIAHR